MLIFQMKTSPVYWPAKAVWEQYSMEHDWSLWADGQAITAVSVFLARGTVVYDDPIPSSFSGTIQTVFLPEGSAGLVDLRLRAEFADGRRLEQAAIFNIFE